MKEMGDKIGESDKSRINAEMDNVRSALNGTDAEAVKAATEKLTEVAYDVFGKVYQAQAQQAQAQGAPQGGYEQPSQSDDGVVDADYEVVDDDKK